MGVPMVQKQVKRRTSLVLGALLALLLGVAAGFLILALPITMLESLTTSIGLSVLMIQAEPPISPNDRTVLAVLAAILTSGIGWVLVDWLLFGRVGMTTLIKPREDEYEDDDDVFRPTDPLDLITSADPASSPEWNASPLGGDTRRPLSARTDIGDPPAPAVASMPGEGRASSPIDLLLPPIDQILPGVAPAIPTPPFGMSPAPAMPNPFGSPAQPSVHFEPNAPIQNAGAPVAPPPVTAAAAPAWLPTPGIRQDPADQTVDDEETSSAASGLAPAWPPVPPMPAPEMPAPVANFPVPPLSPSRGIENGGVDDFFGALPTNPPPFLSQPIAPAPVEPALSPAPAEPLFAPPPAVTPAHPPAGQTTPPLTTAPAAVSPKAGGSGLPADGAPAPTSASSVSAPVTMPPAMPASALLAGNAPLDRAMINELLTRLEQGMRKRRASRNASPVPAPASAPASVPATPPDGAVMLSPAPTEPAPAAMPDYSPPPAAVATPPVEMTPPPSWSPLVEPIVKRPPPAGFAMNDLPPPPPPPITPLHVLPAAPVATTVAANQPDPAGCSGDQMIDQPLHTTLEQLRTMVRR